MIVKATTISRRSTTVLALLVAGLASSVPAGAQQTLTESVNVQASFADRVKVGFDRVDVVFNTEAYDPDSIAPVTATPLTISAKARVAPNSRIIMQVQADGPLHAGAVTIPANKVSWTITGPGFHPNGSALVNAPRTIGSWRGSGAWIGSQIYEFDDDWNYAVGVYTMIMTYTVSMP